tara:strand:+ start:217 stop:603 length:387 start_codon:yes stop_codon:yes gene_type:complete
MKNMSASEFRNNLGNNKATNKRHGKYNAKKCVIDNIKFDSQLEGKHYIHLRNLEKAGQISDLRTHVDYPFTINDVYIGKYEADFVYTDSHGVTHVEDTKGFLTKEYKLKKKLMLALYDIEVVEVYSKK